MPDFHALKVKKIIQETDNAVSLLFDIPEELKPDYKFKAGQYVTVKTQLNGDEIRRDYSLCTNPDSGEFKVVVKAVENGTFSQFANKSLKEGDVLNLGLPQGRFTFSPEPGRQRNVLAVAAGSGITPIMSILSTLLQNEPNSKLVLLYGNKSEKDTIFRNELLELERSYPERFIYVPVYSRVPENGSLFGRIDRSYILNAIKRLKEGESFDAAYLCGPKPLIDLSIEVLKDKGFQDDEIKYELFTSPDTPSETPKNETMSNGICQVEVIVDDETFNFQMDASKTILEAALSHDIDAPYSCQGGICSSCIARIREGEVQMRQNNILTDSEIDQGFILTCQSEPVSAKVVVDYDDV